MLPGLPWLLLWWFPIQFLFKIDAKCTLGCLGSVCSGSPIQFLSKNDAKCPLGCLGSSCSGSLFNSYSKLMPNAPWAVVAPPAVVPNNHTSLQQAEMMMEVTKTTSLDPAMELPLLAGNGSSIDLPFLGCGLRQISQFCPPSSLENRTCQR